MYTHEWMVAAATQGFCSLVGLMVSVSILRIKFSTALWAVLLCNSMPIGTLPGFGTAFLTHDLILPIIILMAVFGRPGGAAPICWLVVTTVFLWPLVGTGLAVMQESQSMVWVTFVVRRFALGLYFVAGAAVSVRRIRAGDLLEACLVVWICMAVAGTLQYLGVVNLDPLSTETGGLESIEESTLAQRGFLGLNRPAVGVWGSAIFGYSLAHIVLNPHPGMARLILHSISIGVSVIVVLFSGSRTGAVALAIAAGFIAIRSIPLLRHTRPARVLLFGAVALLAAQPILLRGAATVAKRLESFQELERVGSFQERVITQRNTIAYVLTDAQAALFGMGPELVRYRYLVGTHLNWPHSEYVFTLWLSGIPGLLLYLSTLAAIFVGLRQSEYAPLKVDAIAGQTILVGGIVMGLTDGCMMIFGTRLVSFGLLMFFVFGLLIRECIQERAGLNGSAYRPQNRFPTAS